MANRLIASSILRQKSTLPRIVLAQCQQQQQRYFQISTTQYNVEKPKEESTATTMTNKFIGKCYY